MRREILQVGLVCKSQAIRAWKVVPCHAEGCGGRIGPVWRVPEVVERDSFAMATAGLSGTCVFMCASNMNAGVKKHGAVSAELLFFLGPPPSHLPAPFYDVPLPIFAQNPRRVSPSVRHAGRLDDAPCMLHAHAPGLRVILSLSPVSIHSCLPSPLTVR